MDKQLDTEIREAYTDVEFIYPDLAHWRFLLEHISYRKEWTKGLPDGEFSIYRGGTPDGFSWTLSEKRATWFASRLLRRDNVYTMIVTKEDILWYTDERKEQEVVLFPNPDKVKLLHQTY